MAKTKRNKAYKPRPVNPQAMNWALSGAHTLPMHKQVELIGYVDVALDRLRQGRAARDDWNTLANGMNIAEALAHFQIGTNLTDRINDAQDELHGIGIRMLSTGKSTCYAHELAAIAEGRDMYKIQLGLCSQAEIMRAVQRVNDFHRSGAMNDVARLYQAMSV
nr:MAG TPA: hypothetical protein [Caudoviricetes sp.]